MPIACRYKLERGPQFCMTDCPVTAPCETFRYARIEHPGDVPAPEAHIVDVAILDMNHGWPNLGHDSLVHAVLDATCDMSADLSDLGIAVRALSFDVRRAAGVPEPPGGRFQLYLGTGGPGHLDPRQNDGVSEGSQGIREDASWEAPLFRLFDRVQESESASLLGVCHTFGVLCRWSGIARPVLRGPEKGGKSTGILENLLTADAVRHPWFRRFADELPPSRRLRVVENRLFDLIPGSRALPAGAIAIGYETLGAGGPMGDALTMLELARDEAGVMPRMFAVNHHPEIVDRFRQRMILKQKHERGEVSDAWFQERDQILTQAYPDERTDQRIHVTSDYTLLGPLGFHLRKLVRRRAEELGRSTSLHENRLLEEATLRPLAP